MPLATVLQTGKYSNIVCRLIILVFTLLIGTVNFTSGYGADSDAGLVVMRANEADNKFIPSRSYGNPVYELVVYHLNLLGSKGKPGVHLMQLWSVFCLFIGLQVLYSCLLMLSGQNKIKAMVGCLCLMAFPAVITNANVVMETIQGMTLVIICVYFFLKFMKTRNQVWLYPLALFLGLSFGTRADYVILAACMALTILVFEVPSNINIVLTSVIYLIAAFVPYYLYFIDGTDIYMQVQMVPNPFLRKLVRACIGLATLFGLPLIIFLMKEVLVKLKTILKLVFFTLFTDPLLFLFLNTASLFLVRYCLLPDEIEYVIILLPFAVMLLCQYANSKKMALFGLLAFIPNLVQIYFLNLDKFNFKFEVGLTDGAIIQDKKSRDYLNSLDLNVIWGNGFAFMNKMGCKKASMDLNCINSNTCDCTVVPEFLLHNLNTDRGLYPNVKKSGIRVFYYPALAYDKSWRTFTKLNPVGPNNNNTFYEVPLEQIP